MRRLKVLASDPIRPVRLWVARNPRTPPDALGQLLHDVDSWVQWNALLHHATPSDALLRLAELEEATYGQRNSLLRSMIVHHPNTSETLRTRLTEEGACRTPGFCAGHDVYRRRDLTR